MFGQTAQIILVILVLSAASAALAQEPAKKPAQEAPQLATPAGGVVVFIDPATGKIRQPDASEIGGLTTPAGPVGSRTPATISQGQDPAAPRTPATLLQGPGGAVGIKLGEDSLTYMVVTKAPDGQLAMDCVTGDKAAAARVTPGTHPASQTPKPDETSKSRAGAQDTHDVKVPR